MTTLQQTTPDVDLPFVVDNNYWHVCPTNDCRMDVALGECLAQKVLRTLKEQGDGALDIFDWIVESQIKNHSNADKNIRTAFWRYIALVVRNGLEN